MQLYCILNLTEVVIYHTAFLSTMLHLNAKTALNTLILRAYTTTASNNNVPLTKRNSEMLLRVIHTVLVNRCFVLKSNTSARKDVKLYKSKNMQWFICQQVNYTVFNLLYSLEDTENASHVFFTRVCCLIETFLTIK